MSIIRVRCYFFVDVGRGRGVLGGFYLWFERYWSRKAYYLTLECYLEASTNTDATLPPALVQQHRHPQHTLCLSSSPSRSLPFFPLSLTTLAFPDRFFTDFSLYPDLDTERDWHRHFYFDFESRGDGLRVILRIDCVDCSCLEFVCGLKFCLKDFVFEIDFFIQRLYLYQ